MCLTAIKSTPQKSEASIPVYKVLYEKDGKLYTPVKDYEVQLNIPLHDEKEITTTSYREYTLIEAGYFHVFSTLERAKTYVKNISPKNRHLFDIYEAEIPANTDYITGYDSEMCTKSLIIKNKI